MILQDENNQPLIINTLTTKVSSQYAWTFDLKQLDYMLHKFQILEENKCPTHYIEINNTIIKVPSYWYMLVADEFTMQLDSVPVSMLSNNNYNAFSFGINHKKPLFPTIRVVDYKLEDTNVYPSFNRQSMILHDIGNGMNCGLSFTDSYGRFLKNVHVGDII